MSKKMSFKKTLDELNYDCQKCRFKVCKDTGNMTPCVQEGCIRALECIDAIHTYIQELETARDFVLTGRDIYSQGKAEVLTNVINQLKQIIDESED